MDVEYEERTIGCGERILDFSYRSGEVQDLPSFYSYFIPPTPYHNLSPSNNTINLSFCKFFCFNFLLLYF